MVLLNDPYFVKKLPTLLVLLFVCGHVAVEIEKWFSMVNRFFTSFFFAEMRGNPLSYFLGLSRILFLLYYSHDNTLMSTLLQQWNASLGLIHLNIFAINLHETQIYLWPAQLACVQSPRMNDNLNH